MYHHALGCPQCDDSQCSDAQTVAQSRHKLRNLWIAFALISVFSIAELWVSRSSHSLALLADAGHLLSDSGALAIALFATWMAQRPVSGQATFGYRRVEILAALVNGVGLVAIAVWIGIEAIARLNAVETEILSGPMLVTAFVGLIINSLNATLLHGHAHHDLNLRGAVLHMLADVASAVGVMLAALVVWAFQWNWADAAMSIGVGVLILVGSVPLIRQSLRILLEQSPDHLDVSEIQAHIAAFDGVIAVDQLRVWTIALGQDALTARLTVSLTDGMQRDRLLEQITTSLQDEFGICNVVLQMSLPVARSPISLSIPERLELLR